MNFPRSLKFPFALFLILYFFYLVGSNAPAVWGAWIATKAVPGLWMSAAEGSLWRGSANSAQIDVPGQTPMALGRVEWHLSPWSLLILRPCLRFETSLPRQTMGGRVCQSVFGGTSIKNFNLDIPVPIINAYLPLDFDGDLSVQVAQAKLDGQRRISSLDARFSWQRGRAMFDGNWMSLGSFAGTAKESPNGGAIAEIFELEGPFKVALTAELTDFKQSWKVAGTVTPQAGASDMLVQGLQILGEDIGNGSYKVQWP